MSIELGLFTLLSLATVSGYVQTPKGGLPGSSDLQRPTFQELGIQGAPISDRLIKFHSGFYMGYQQIRLKGDVILPQPLKTYRIPIPAKTPMESDIKFDWYRVGYVYAIHPKNSRWKLSPEIEVAMLDFDYRFKIPLISTGRAYHHVGVRIGFTFEYPINDTVTFSFHRSISLPWPKRLQITSQRMGFQIQSIAMGHQETQIWFKDGQKLPNYLSFNGDGVFLSF